MTLRFLLSTVLDESYGFKIEGIKYECADNIPEKYLDNTVKKVRPLNNEQEAIYVIYFVK